MTNVTQQFISAVQAITSAGTPLYKLCGATGIDRRNLVRTMQNPERYNVRPQWLAALCKSFRVSSDYLLCGRGCIFENLGDDGRKH